MILNITSTSNPKIKQVLNLREKRERDQTKLFLIEGYRECTRAIESNISFVQFFFSEELFSCIIKIILRRIACLLLEQPCISK